MRSIPNILIVITISILLYGGWQVGRTILEEERAIEATRQERVRFEAELRLRSALAGARTSPRGWVLQVSPGWFRNPPCNHLLPNVGPWLEVAGPLDRQLRHPRDRGVTCGLIAGWWYNPVTGDLRARVPTQRSQARTENLYSAVNR